MPKIDTLHPIDAFGIQKVSMSGIRAEKLEDRVKPGVPFPHKHDFFQIMIVTKGSGLHQIDFINHKVSPGMVYMMKPGQMHSWQLKNGIRGFIVEFNYQSLNAFRDSTRLIKDISISPDVFEITKAKELTEILFLIEIMSREENDLCLQAYVTSFLIKLLRMQKTNIKQEKTITTIEKFRELVEKNFRSSHSVDFYAQELNTSAKALAMQLSRSIGKPPRDIIQERILLEAKRYLAFSELAISEIGYELGFEDANYFTRFFKLHEKKTPAQFRKFSKTTHRL